MNEADDVMASGYIRVEGDDKGRYVNNLRGGGNGQVRLWRCF